MIREIRELEWDCTSENNSGSGVNIWLVSDLGIIT